VEEVYFYIAYILVVAYSIIMHEIAHGVAAYKEGDDTAKISGRITLNPIPHIDLFGTIILPGVLILMQALSNGAGVVFGWAKPVPVNPLRFRHGVRSDIFVSMAGIIVNFLLGYMFILLLHIAPEGSMNERLFISAAAINIFLAVFNLVPIPPLDGSHVFKYLLPRDVRRKYENLGFHGMFLIFIFLMVGRGILSYLFFNVFFLFMYLGGHGW